MRNDLINEIDNVPFYFKFNKSATSQIKKQYDGYVQFWSKNSESRVLTVNLYLWNIVLLKLYLLTASFKKEHLY